MNLYECPETVYFYPTLKCNLCCQMCVSDANVLSGKCDEVELSLEQYKKLIYELYNMGVRTFDISGGEPLLRRDILEILMEIKKYDGVNVIMVSNGTLWRSGFEQYQRLLKYIDKLYISIDANDADTHDRIRGKRGTFEIAIKGVKKIVEFGYNNVYINTVITSLNYDKVYDILTMVSDLNCRGVSFLRLLEVSTESKAMKINMDGYIRVLKQISQWLINEKRKMRSIEINIVVPGYYYNKLKVLEEYQILKENKVNIEYDPLRGCNAYRKSIIVTTDGYVTGCTALLGNSQMYVGNVNKEELEDIMCVFALYRRNISSREKELKGKEPCWNCSEWNVCRGGCPAMNDVMVSGGGLCINLQ